jgi:hypothetical protein
MLEREYFIPDLGRSTGAHEGVKIPSFTRWIEGNRVIFTTPRKIMNRRTRKICEPFFVGRKKPGIERQRDVPIVVDEAFATVLSKQRMKARAQEIQIFCGMRFREENDVGALGRISERVNFERIHRSRILEPCNRGPLFGIGGSQENLHGALTRIV